MGLLDDLSQFQPSPADQDNARRMGLLAAGLAMLGARRGSELGTFGNAGLLGMQTYQNALSNQQKQMLERMQAASALMTLKEQQQKFTDLDAQRQALGAALIPQAGSNPMQSAMAAAPSLSPTNANVASITQQAAASGSPDLYTRLNNAADAMEQQAIALAKQGNNGAPSVLALANQYREQAQKYAPQYDGTETLMQNGQPTVVQKFKNRPIQAVPGFQPKPDYKQVNTGQSTMFVDPLTNAIGPSFQMQATPGELLSRDTALQGQQITMRGQNMSAATAANSLAESKRYHDMELGIDQNGVPTNVDAVAKAIATYQQPPLSSFAMAKPIGAQIMGKVMELNPTYDAKNYQTAQQTANAFARGSQGNTVRSIGVAMQHLDVLSQAGDALANGNYPLFNRLGNAVASQTGKAAPTNFNAVKDLVANEITKAITGSGGGVSDRDKAQKTVDAANSPQQLKAVIDSYKQLFAGQLSGLKTQYEAGTQRSDFTKFLSPETAALLPRSQQANDIRSQADRILQGK